MDDYELAQTYETVNLYRRGGAAKIELNRPETRNAWNTQFSVDLLAALRAAGDDAGVRAVLLELSSSSRRTKMFPPTPNQLVRRLRVPARKPRLIGLIPEPFSAESRCAASSALFGKRQGSARHVTSFHFAAMRPITNCIPCDRQHHDFKYHLGRGHTGTRSGTWARSWPFRNARDSSETHHTMLRGSRSSRFR